MNIKILSIVPILVGACVGLCLLIPTLAQAQQPPQTPALFGTMKIEATVVVRKHNTGADIVEITPLSATCTPQDLVAISTRLNEELKGSVRGVQVVDISPSAESKMIRISFGCDGLIDRTKGVLRVKPIAKAFAAMTGKEKIRGIMIQFDGEAPGANSIQRFVSNAVEVEAKTAGDQYGVEYRVLLKTSDPKLIDIPEGEEKQSNDPIPAKPSSDKALWIVLVIAGVGAGGLVYCLLLWPRSRGGGRSR